MMHDRHGSKLADYYKETLARVRAHLSSKFAVEFDHGDDKDSLHVLQLNPNSIVWRVTVVAFVMIASVGAYGDSPQPATKWQSPPKELLKVLHAPQLPRVWTAPTGEYLLLADPVLYPPLAELASPMHKLAGIRVNPAINGHHGHHGQHGGTSPRLVRVEGGTRPTSLSASSPSVVPSSRQKLLHYEYNLNT